MTDPNGHPDWQPYTITAALAEAQESAVREKTVGAMRDYSAAVASLGEFGHAWRETVRKGLADGLSVEEIAAEWRIETSSVHAALYGDDIWPLHDAGIPCAAIAKRLGISREIVASILGPGSDFGDNQREG